MFKQVLSNNRMVTIQDYVNTFHFHRNKASRQMKLDIEEYKIKRFTVLKFFEIYESYPRKFKPQYLTVELN